MPMYDFKCLCGREESLFMKIAETVAQTPCVCGDFLRKQVSAPFVRPDIQAYVSPTTGKVVSSRAQRVEDMKRSGSIEYDPDRSKELRQRAAQRDIDLDKSIDQGLDRTLAAMPVKKLERLDAEIRSGADISVTRSTPNVA